MMEWVLGLIDDSGGDLFFGEIVDILVGLFLGDLRDSLVLVEMLIILVDFFNELLVSFNKIREELTVDSDDGYHE